MIASMGCSDPFGTEAVATESPSSEQIQRCREAMFIDTDVVIEAIGYHRRPDFRFNDFAFKFTTTADHIDQIFDSNAIPSSEFVGSKFEDSEFHPGKFLDVAESWWDPQSMPLKIARYSNPAAKRSETQFATIGLSRNDDGSFVVFVRARVNGE